MAGIEPSESQIELAICHFFASKRLFFWKQPQSGYFDAKIKRFRKHANPFALNGVPDILIVHKGRLIGVEVKTRLGRLTEAQTLFERQMRAAGGLYYIARSIEDAENIYRAIQLIV